MTPTSLVNKLLADIKMYIIDLFLNEFPLDLLQVSIWFIYLVYTSIYPGHIKISHERRDHELKRLKKLCIKWPDEVFVHRTWWVLVLQTHVYSLSCILYSDDQENVWRHDLDHLPPPPSQLHLQLHLLIFAGIQIFPTQSFSVLYCSERNGWLSILSINLPLFPWIPSSQRKGAKENEGLGGQRTFIWLLMGEELRLGLGVWKPPNGEVSTIGEIMKLHLLHLEKREPCLIILTAHAVKIRAWVCVQRTDLFSDHIIIKGQL